MLKGLGNYYTFERFLGAIEKTGDKVKTANDTIKGINEATGHFFVHLGKEALFGIANLMNLSKYMPSWLVPELYPEQRKHMEEISKRPRFPPKGSLTRPSYYKKYNRKKQKSQEDTQNKIFEEEMLKIYNRIHQSPFLDLIGLVNCHYRQKN